MRLPWWNCSYPRNVISGFLAIQLSAKPFRISLKEIAIFSDDRVAGSRLNLVKEKSRYGIHLIK